MSKEPLYLDLETFSETPIKDGTYRYAEDAEIMLFAYAIGEWDPNVWDLTAGEPMPEDLREAWYDEETPIICQNSMFDRTVLRKQFAKFTNYQPPIERWEDTMVQAYCHGLPGSLDSLCELFKVPLSERKQKTGKELIQLFCKPRPKNQKIRRATRLTHPVEWALFKSYAGSDITSMRSLRKVLPKWNYPGIELERWRLDQRINDEGFDVDVEFARAAVEACERAKSTLASRTVELTNGEVERATQRDRLLKHLLSEYGVDLPDTKSSTLETRLTDENLPWPVRELLAIRLQASTTSTAKYKTLLKAVTTDGKIHGALQFSGAQRTGRWAGRIFQPQNLPRPTRKAEEIFEGIDAVKAGHIDLVEDNVMDLLSNALRGVIVAPEGHKLVVSDLSNIEGRVLAWLAGEDWKLQAFRDYDAGVGHDLYHITAGSILGKDPGPIDNPTITKAERQMAGKVPELACGFQGAVGAFNSMAALYGLVLPEKRVLEIVRGWRAKNAAIVVFWHALDDTVRRAIFKPGVELTCGKLKVRRDGAWLRVILPSGRSLCYASPQIVGDKITYMGMCPYTKRWKRLVTYGGKLVENATQATAAEVLKHNMPAVWDAGYTIVLTVHDEIITRCLDVARFSERHLSGMLQTVPWWAKGLPLAAKGMETKRYHKDD